MNNKIVLLLTMLISASCYGSFDQHYGSARPISLGGAFAGLSDTGDAMYYNPAGLAQVTRPEMMGAYSKMYVGLDDNSNLSFGNLSITYPFKRAPKYSTDNKTVSGEGIRSDLGVMGTVGLGVDMFSLDSYYNETVMGLYYGGRVSNMFLVGLGVKYLTIGYGSDAYTAINPVFAGGLTKSAVSFDAGLMALLSSHFSAGLAVKDANSPDMGLKYEDLVSRKITVGGAYRNTGYNITADVGMDSLNNTKFSAGGEKWFMNNMLAVRAGFGIGSRKYSRINTGFGYEGENIFLDYAFYYPLSGLSDTYGSHEATFGYRFGSSVKSNIRKAVQLKELLVKDLMTGDFAQALKKSERCVELAPSAQEYAVLKNNLELVIKNVGSDLRAADRSNEALRKGVVQYISEQDAAGAVQTLSYAYSLNPDRMEIDKLTRVIAKENNIKLEEGAKTWNLAEQKVYQALDKFKEKKYDEAIKLCEEALSLEPNNVTAYKRLGSIFYVLKDYQRARTNWEKAVALAPDDKDMPQIRELMKKIQNR